MITDGTVSVNQLHFRRGKASAFGFSSCLIHTLLQVVNRVVPIVHDESQDARSLVGAVRNELRKEFQAGPSKVTADNFLEFGDHWRRIVFHLGVMARKRGLDPDGRVQPGMFTMTLVDAHAVYNDAVYA